MNRCPGIASLAIGILLLFTSSAQAAATAYIISGEVTAPGGIIASGDRSGESPLARVLDFLVPSAEAGMSGLLAVPNGTRVELVKIGNGGGMSAPIATTTVRYGRYQFNLSALRRTVSSRLIVRVGNVATGAQMRAFVSDKTVDIHPASEAAVRMVLDSIASNPNATLDNFTVVELEDLAGSLDLLTSADAMQTAADIESSVLAIRDAAADNAGIMNFLTAMTRTGQTSAGPGDIGNFFPFTQGFSWTYSVQETEDNIASASYLNTETVGGIRLIKGVATTVVKESNPDGDGKTDKYFYKKTNSGMFDWTPVQDGIQNTPYRSVRFPAAPGSSFKQSLGSMGLNKDYDRDGIVERFSFTATTTVLGLETIDVPAGNLPNSLKIRTVVTGGTTVSGTRKKMVMTVKAVEWYTKNLGLAKQVVSTRITYNGRVLKDTRSAELAEANGFPFAGDFPLARWISLDIVPNSLICDSVSGKLFVSVPTGAAQHADSVVVIDPDTAEIEATIPVGPNPGPMAISNDGQFLYVALGGAQGAIRQISIPTLQAGPEWMISNRVISEFTSHPRYACDMAVQPDDPEKLLISHNSYPMSQYSWGCSGGNYNLLMMDHGEEVSVNSSQYYISSYIESTNTPGTFYGYGSWNQYTFFIDNDGNMTHERRATTGLDYAVLDYELDDGLIYTNNGKTLDPNTGTVTGTYASEHSGFRSIEPVSTRNRVAISQVDDGYLYIEFYNMATFSKLGEQKIPADRFYENVAELESCGSNGYATYLHKTPVLGNASRLVLTKNP